jgi:hypothetical protein
MITVTVEHKKNDEGEFFEAYFSKDGNAYSYYVPYKFDNAEDNEYRDNDIASFQTDALNGLLKQEFGSTIITDFRNSPEHWHYLYDDDSIPYINPDDLEVPSIFNITNKDFHTTENHPWQPFSTAPKDGTIFDALFLIDGQKVRIPNVYFHNNSIYFEEISSHLLAKIDPPMENQFERGELVHSFSSNDPKVTQKAIYWKKVNDDPFYHPWLE